MVMTWTSLTGPKSLVGSVAYWTGYSKLDGPTIVAEAESLLFSLLRVREMRTEWTFGMAVGQCQTPLPTRFLDPIGRLYDVENSMQYPHKIETDITAARSYSPLTGSYGTNPFTTTLGSSLVTANVPSHSLNQASTIFNAAASAVGGMPMNGAFSIVSIIDANNFVFDTEFDGGATSGATGGGSLATYTANNLISGSPSRWSIWDEQIKFDSAFDTQTTFKQLYYRSPPPLSAVNPTHFATARYPMLMRKACAAAAADFMKDDTEYQKNVTALNNLVHSVAVENDMIYRGAEFGTDTP
jgi:hypothetical protein